MSYQKKTNSLKLRALKIFKERGKINPRAWAVRAKFIPVRSAYTYLLRLHRFGLLDRTYDQAGEILYGLSVRGSARLQWLAEQSHMRLILKDQITNATKT